MNSINSWTIATIGNHTGAVMNVRTIVPAIMSNISIMVLYSFPHGLIDHPIVEIWLGDFANNKYILFIITLKGNK